MEARSKGLTRGSFVAHILVMSGAAIAYVLFSSFDMDFAATLLAPAAEMYAAVILFRASQDVFRFRRSWFYFGLSICIYALTDIVWAVLELGYGVNPDDLLLMSIAYLLPNLFLVMGVAAFFRAHFRNWNTTQLIVDLTAILIVLLSTFWVLFFRNWVSDNLFEDPFAVLLYLYLLFDMLGLGLVLVLALTIRVRLATAPVLIALVGFLLYAGFDMLYAWQSYQESYTSNNLVDIGFVGAQMVFGVAGLHRLRYPFREPQRLTDLPVNIRWRPGILLLLFSPVLLWIAGRMRLFDIFLAVGVVVVHGLVSAFLQVAVKNELLLGREREMTEQLELRVKERTADLLQANEELNMLANRDLITGLLNRRRFQQELEQLLDGIPGEKPTVALLYMDMDRFKGINDAYGHEVGDKILLEMANRLQGIVSTDMLISRPGGDEFMLAAPGLSDTNDIRMLASRIIDAFEVPVEVEPWQFSLSVSMGIVKYPEDASDRVSLFQLADMAMYHAKAQDSPRYAFYSNWFSEGMNRRHALEMALRRADYDKEFTLHYQPQFLSRKRTLVGMEALLRWESPELGTVSPGEFIPVAEATGLILPIGQWVTKTALARISDWNHRFGGALRMGINFSPKQFDVAGFIDTFQEQMRQQGIPPSWVDVEITENTAMRTEASMEEMLTALASVGVSISIDDFGTGYSSLSYIKRFDIDCLKIAKPLIDNIALDEGDAQIVGAIVLMAKTMRLRTIAEGVEDEQQLEILQRLGCDEIQGYLLGKPVSRERFEALWLSKESGII